MLRVTDNYVFILTLWCYIWDVHFLLTLQLNIRLMRNWEKKKKVI